MERLIERAIRTRQDHMLESMRSILIGGPVHLSQGVADRFTEEKQALFRSANYAESAPLFFEHEMSPDSYRAHRFTTGELLQASDEGDIAFNGWPFLYHPKTATPYRYLNEGLLMEFPADGWDELSFYQFWALSEAGLLLQQSRPWEDYKYRGYNIISVISIPENIIQALKTLVNYYTALGFTTESISWKFRFFGVEGFRLQSFTSMILSSNQPCAISTIEYDLTLSLADWSAGLIEHATTASLFALQRFGFTPHPSVVVKMIHDVLDRKVH